MKIIDLVQGSDPWLSYRKSKVMASEVAAILNSSEYETPFQRWQRKLGLSPEQEETPAMRRGKELEPIARKKFCEGWGIHMIPVVGQSDSHEWMAASFDGFSSNDNSILEIKCNGKKNHDIALGGEVPYSHWLQMQQQMYVAEVKQGYYYSFDGMDGITIEVKYDYDFFNRVIPQLYAFWKGLILFEPPALTPRDYKDMGKDQTWRNLSDRYLFLDEDIKRKEEEKDSIRKHLIQLCADSNCKGNGIKILKTIQRGRVDYDRIDLLKQVDLDKYRKDPTASWRIYVE